MVLRVGAWLFKHRTAIPIPIALALLLIPASSTSALLAWSGSVLVAAGEIVRLLAVRQIGAISRTRTDRLGPLVAAGPFALVRNPLYLGNIALWLGFAMVAQLPSIVAPIAILLAVEYQAIVRWEEALLETRLGDGYRAYAGQVPRWIPRLAPAKGERVDHRSRATFSWRETLFSERGTLIAIAAGFLLLSLKAILRSEF